jgi:hypothetical protein
MRALARRYGINPKTVRKWKCRCSTVDAPMGPEIPSTPCFPSTTASMPCKPLSRIQHARRSTAVCSSRLPEIEGEKASKKKFKTYPIGLFHIDIAEDRTEEGRLYPFVAIDRTSKLAFAKLRLAGVIQVTTQRDYTPSSIGAAFHTFNLTIKLRFARL